MEHSFQVLLSVVEEEKKKEEEELWRATASRLARPGRAGQRHPTTNGGAAATSANIQTYMNRLYVQLVRGADKPDLIVADNNYWRLYLESLQAIQRITSEGGVAAGVRRVEALTGDNALTYVQGMESALGGVAGTLKVLRADVPARVISLLDQVRGLEKELDAIKGKLASAQGDELMAQAVDVGGIKVLAARLEGADAKALRETLDKLKDKLKTAVVVLASVDGCKVQLAAGVTADSIGRVKAGELVNFVAQQVGGKGGGKPDMAMAGGTEPGKLDAALASAQAWVAGKL